MRKEPAWLRYLSAASCVELCNEQGKSTLKVNAPNAAVIMRGIQQLNFIDVLPMVEDRGGLGAEIANSGADCPEMYQDVKSPTSKKGRGGKKGKSPKSKPSPSAEIIPKGFTWEDLPQHYASSAAHLEYHYASVDLLSRLCEGHRPENELVVTQQFPWSKMLDGVFQPMKGCPWTAGSSDSGGAGWSAAINSSKPKVEMPNPAPASTPLSSPCLPLPVLPNQ